MKHLLYLLIALYSIPSLADVDLLGQSLIDEVNTSPGDLDAREQLVSYYFQENMETEGREEAKSGFDLSTNDYYRYSFYDHVIRNKFFVEAFTGSNQIYSRYGLFLQSSHNYHQGNWIYVNFLQEYRKYNDVIAGTQLGLGHILRMTPEAYLQTTIYVSPTRKWMAGFALENELFYGTGQNTYSFMVRLSQYENVALALLSASIRHDEDLYYMGARGYLTDTPSDLLPSARFFLGHTFDYKTWGELGISFGKEVEDGYVATQFTATDVQIKHKISFDKDIGLKFVNYNSEVLRNDNTFSVNFLWKY